MKTSQRVQSLLDSLLTAKGEAPSLRLTDHLVLQYARERSINIQWDSNVRKGLWSDYRRMLTSIGMDFFDFFKKRLLTREYKKQLMTDEPAMLDLNRQSTTDSTVMNNSRDWASMF